MTKPDLDELCSDICQFLGSMVGSEVRPEDELQSQGVDSIAFLELVIFLERKLSIPLPLDILTTKPLTTARALTEQLDAIVSRHESLPR